MSNYLWTGVLLFRENFTFTQCSSEHSVALFSLHSERRSFHSLTRLLVAPHRSDVTYTEKWKKKLKCFNYVMLLRRLLLWWCNGCPTGNHSVFCLMIFKIQPNLWWLSVETQLMSCDICCNSVMFSINLLQKYFLCTIPFLFFYADDSQFYLQFSPTIFFADFENVDYSLQGVEVSEPEWW